MIDFINSREFQKKNPKVFECRKARYEKNLKIILFMLIIGHFCLATFYVFPLIEQNNKFQLSIYFPIDFDEHQIIYYICNVFVAYASWLSAMLENNGCLLLSSLISFLSNEFKILGMAFEDVLQQIDEQNDELHLKKIENQLKENVLHYVKLIGYAFLVMKQSNPRKVYCRYFKKLQALLYWPMFCQLIASGFLLAFISYQMVATDDHMNVRILAQLQYIGFCFLELLMYCYRGEELSNEV